MVIEVGFAPEKAEIMLGEPLFIAFTVIGRSEKPCRFFVGGDDRGSTRHNSFHIEAVDAQGLEVRDPNTDGHARTDREQSRDSGTAQTVDPGQTRPEAVTALQQEESLE